MFGILIIGAGQAAASFSASYRAVDPDTPITLVGQEPSIPYQRPPLSKKYALGEMSVAQLHLRPDTWYADQNVTLITGQAVTEISREAKSAKLSDGRELSWDKLFFATGADVRRLPESVTKGLSNILYLRSLADADALAEKLEAGKRIVIVGGGYIGLEAAAVCAKQGMNVTLLEAAPRILQRVACAETADWFRELHESEGVRIIEGTGLSHFEGHDGTLQAAHLSDGTVLEADLALVGIGIVPNVNLAEAAGLRVATGIEVDHTGQTSDPAIYAAGDCAEFRYQGQPTRLESVPNAIDQATIAAQAMSGQDVTYLVKPWFWSDQYDVKLQIAGLNRGYDQVVTRPCEKPRSAAHFYYREGQLCAVDAMNEPRVYMVSKRLLEAGKTIAPEQAMDPAFELKSLL
ncbi:MAG: FAD/NAD(P)-binding oxidoreductase [Pseudomonadota bacterium]